MAHARDAPGPHLLRYLRASGLDYTIVRPGGLKAEPPTGALFVSAENTLNSGEISRDLVAEVAVAAPYDALAITPTLTLALTRGRRLFDAKATLTLTLKLTLTLTLTLTLNVT